MAGPPGKMTFASLTVSSVSMSAAAPSLPKHSLARAKTNPILQRFWVYFQNAKAINQQCPWTLCNVADMELALMGAQEASKEGPECTNGL